MCIFLTTNLYDVKKDDDEVKYKNKLVLTFFIVFNNVFALFWIETKNQIFVIELLFIITFVNLFTKLSLSSFYHVKERLKSIQIDTK